MGWYSGSDGGEGENGGKLREDGRCERIVSLVWNRETENVGSWANHQPTTTSCILEAKVQLWWQQILLIFLRINVQKL